jgi:hypothetical protein
MDHTGHCSKVAATKHQDLIYSRARFLLQSYAEPVNQEDQTVSRISTLLRDPTDGDLKDPRADPRQRTRRRTSTIRISRHDHRLSFNVVQFVSYYQLNMQFHSITNYTH